MSNTLEIDYPCFLSVNSVQKFFKNSTNGVNHEKLYQMVKVNSLQETQNCITVWSYGVMV
jgi:hypothetical protein